MGLFLVTPTPEREALDSRPVLITIKPGAVTARKAMFLEYYTCQMVWHVLHT